ncbi:MAG: DUF4304 domain-containing protein [Myxococcota bacterium]|nr:DUF4304 domain-containing protein [Myxococcota bacterium]
MIASLKENVVPRLRELGFKGSFPHFHRPLPSRTDLLTVQFDKYGGSFTVEIVKAPPGDFTTSWGEVVPVKKLRTSYFEIYERLRLGARDVRSDHWFNYRRGLVFRRHPKFQEISLQVRQLIDSQAEPWWNAA